MSHSHDNPGSEAQPTARGVQGDGTESEILRLSGRFASHLRAGLNPRIEEFLERLTSEHRTAGFYALMALEHRYRQEQNEPTLVQTYRDRFPEHAEWIEALMGVRPLSFALTPTPFHPASDPGAPAPSTQTDVGGVPSVGRFAANANSKIPTTDYDHKNRHSDGSEMRMRIGSGKEIADSGTRDEHERGHAHTGESPTVKDFSPFPNRCGAGSSEPHDGPGWSVTPRFLSPGAAAPYPEGGERVKIFGDYHLIREIGRGGSGVVHMARMAREDRYTALNRVVALKRLMPNRFSTADDVQRFRAETESASMLDHPHIVPIYEVGQYEEQNYFTMKYIQGGSLAEKIRKRSLDPKKAVDIMIMVARATNHAHRHGILHRDLKPANILMDENDHPYVTDFGLAKRLKDDGGMTHSGMVVGSPSYMAPEQASGTKNLTVAADIYSLGAILYEMLTGTPPFVAESPVLTLQKVLYSSVRRPRQINPNIHRDLETICLKCLDKDPLRRYETAEDLAEDLLCRQNSRPIRGRPTPAWELVVMWAQRRPGIALLVAALTLSVIFGVLGILHQWREADRARDEANRQSEYTWNAFVQAQKERIRAQHSAYVLDMNLAQRAWNDAQISRTLKILKKYQPSPAAAALNADSQPIAAAEDFRGFEWWYLNRLCRTERKHFQEHTGEIHALAVASATTTVDNAAVELFATSSADESVRIWDNTRNRCLFTLRKHVGLVMGLAFAPDGRTLATGGWDETIVLWDTSTGTVRKELTDFQTGGEQIDCLAYSPNGRRFAAAGNRGTLIVWNTADWSIAQKINADSTVNALAFCPASAQLAAACDNGQIQIRDIDNPNHNIALTGHELSVNAISFSPDGKLLASAGNDKTARIWDINTNTARCVTPRTAAELTGAVFFPSGDRFAACGKDNIIHIWDLRANEIGVIKGHEGAVNALAFGRDGTTLISCGADRTVRVWNAFDNQESRIVRLATPQVDSGRSQYAQDSAFLGDERFIIVGSGNSANVCSLTTGTVIQNLADLRVFAVSPDGATLAASRNDVNLVIYKFTEKNELQPLPAQPPDAHNSAVAAIRFSPKGDRMYTVGDDRMLILWDTRTWRPVTHTSYSGNILRKLVPHPDGLSLALLNGEDTVTIVDARNFREIAALAGHTKSVEALAFSPDGAWVATASADMSIRVHSAKTWKYTFELLGHARPVKSLAFSADGARLFSGGDDGEIKIWDPATQSEIYTLHGHTGSVRQIRPFSRNQDLFSYASDNTVRIWSATPATTSERSRE